MFLKKIFLDCFGVQKVVLIKKKEKNISYVLKERISITIVQYLPFQSSRSRFYKKERKRTLVTFFIKQKHPIRLKPTSKPLSFQETI